MWRLFRPCPRSACTPMCRREVMSETIFSAYQFLRRRDRRLLKVFWTLFSWMAVRAGADVPWRQQLRNSSYLRLGGFVCLLGFPLESLGFLLELLAVLLQLFA